MLKLKWFSEKYYYCVFNFVILNETLFVEMKNLITIIVRDISVVQKTNFFNMTTLKFENQFALDIQQKNGWR